ncbi:MAG TPA: UDP-N-acetylmuramoyl-L-alanine--D-glutamate ligase [Gaiellales bacterium]|nr:UDP-N-acetylmuramoyl-L-alanine--D-glutamate ligase [Gaiellales bacterium]
MSPAGPPQRYLVVGLRRSGLAAGEAIARCWPRAQVCGTDSNPAVDTGRLLAAGVELVAWGDDQALEGVDAVIKSPGVPAHAPPVGRARELGVPVWSEVELASRMLPNPILGVTGTNGKTTTTELVGAMLREGGVAVEVAGNVGRPLSALAGRVDPAAWIACELSSFQLEDIETMRCRVAAVLNITPDHLDRHGTLEDYARCKLRILENQTAGDTAVLNGDDPVLAAAGLPGAGRRVWVSSAQRGGIDWEHAGLRGDHNLANALAATAAARAVGVDGAACDRALRGFRPPPHRLEPVTEAAGVRFVNDSKATNPDAAIKALTAFSGGVRLILGGSSKGGDFAPLAAAVAAGPVASVYLIGAAAEAISAALAAAGVAAADCGTLDRAVRAAAADAGPGDTVLLAPACASFDQFRDFEHRGDSFRRLALEVAGGG